MLAGVRYPPGLRGRSGWPGARGRSGSSGRRGQATKAVLQAVAAALGVRRSVVTLVRGSTSRDKLVDVEGEESEIQPRLETLLVRVVQSRGEPTVRYPRRVMACRRPRAGERVPGIR